MDSVVRPGLLMNKQLWRLIQSTRHFQVRRSTGLGSSRSEKIKEFYQDRKMDKLWKNTFDRIASFQRQTEQSPANNPSMGTISKPPSQLFSMDDQQLMKVSFAEGYFYGQENVRKQPRFGHITMVGGLWILVIGYTIYYLFSTDSPFKKALMGRQFEIHPDDINVSFADVKGCDESKKELKDIVEFLRNPTRFSRLGGKLPKGVLLIGPPGTGKTLLARAVAGEAKVPFFHASGSEFDEILVGQGARRVRDLFEKAKQRTPCVIFIDEIDSVGGKRTNSGLHPYANQTINQLLSEMDGFSQSEGVIVIGATNRADDLDKALLRPGRFDVQVHVSRPDYKGRRELFNHYLDKIQASDDVDVELLCKTTVGFTGADIENVVNQAALKSATDGADLVSQSALEYARDKILMGPERRSRLPDAEQNKMTAFHEGGHTLVSYYTPKAPKVHKVTIIMRNNSMGHTAMMYDKDMYGQTKEELTAQIDVMLGGRIAEEMVFGPERVTTGCSNDLNKANSIAVQMVKDFGMSDKIGMRTIREDDRGSQMVVNSFSDATSELVESEINRILEESKERVKAVLTEHSAELKRLADALLKYETLDGAEVKLIIEGKDPRPLSHDKQREQGPRARPANNVKLPGPKLDDRLPLNLFK